MNKSLCLALAVVVLSVGSLPAATFAKEMQLLEGGAIRCESTVTMNAISAISTELMLETKQGASIDTFNGCLKVTYNDAAGSMIEFYDPDTLNLIGRLHVGA